MLEIWVDGSSRGNPGLSGVGILVKKDGKLLEEIELIIGENITNNEAEYRAVIEGLKRFSLLNNNDDCIIYTDSSLIYGQLVLSWKINHQHLKDLNIMARELLSDRIKIKLIKREENLADELAQDITSRKGITWIERNFE